MRTTISLFIIVSFMISVMTPSIAVLSGDKSFIEICTAQGIKRVAIDSPIEDEKPRAVHDHCPFCLHKTDKIAADFGAYQINAPMIQKDEIIAIERDAPRVRISSYHTPRAPPSFKNFA